MLHTAWLCDPLEKVMNNLGLEVAYLHSSSLLHIKQKAALCLPSMAQKAAWCRAR